MGKKTKRVVFYNKEYITEYTIDLGGTKMYISFDIRTMHQVNKLHRNYSEEFQNWHDKASKWQDKYEGTRRFFRRDDEA